MITQAISEEELQVRQLAREFAEAELRPHVERWDRDRAMDAEVLGKLAELGFFGMLVPEEYGGLDFDTTTYAAVLEELAWGEPSVALTLSIHSAFATGMILRHGTDEQKRRWLEPLASGELLGCFALSEEQAGSDAAAVQATARRDGEEWVLEGTKKWVTHASAAGLALVVARTGEDGLGVFIVPTDSKGWIPGKVEKTMGMRAVETASVELRALRVPADALLGEPDKGLSYALEALVLGRIGIAAQAVGTARAALEHAIRYADEREQFGRKIREFEGIQFKLAEMATRVEAAAALTRRAASEPTAANAAMAKLFASETAMEVTTEAVQIFGGYGYMRDYPVEKLMRDAKATEIYEGTNEIQRVIIARELYRA